MPEVAYTTTSGLPGELVWDFVQDMDNWATFVAGYQEHAKESETESVWTLKGDVGVLTRTVKFRVRVTEWRGPERVTFTLDGLNEPLSGEGSFHMGPGEEAALEPAPARRRNVFQRVLEALARFFLRRGRGAPRRAESTSAPAGGLARLTFRLRLEPAGPMAPMLNAMLEPPMRAAAEDLANRILAELEARHGRR